MRTDDTDGCSCWWCLEKTPIIGTATAPRSTKGRQRQNKREHEGAERGPSRQSPSSMNGSSSCSLIRLSFFVRSINKTDRPRVTPSNCWVPSANACCMLHPQRGTSRARIAERFLVLRIFLFSGQWRITPQSARVREDTNLRASTTRVRFRNHCGPAGFLLLELESRFRSTMRTGGYSMQRGTRRPWPENMDSEAACAGCPNVGPPSYFDGTGMMSSSIHC